MPQYQVKVKTEDGEIRVYAIDTPKTMEEAKADFLHHQTLRNPTTGDPLVTAGEVISIEPRPAGPSPAPRHGITLSGHGGGASPL